MGRGGGTHEVILSRFLDRQATILYHPSPLRRQGAGSKGRARGDPVGLPACGIQPRQIPG
jgi:hypothetical protein